MAFNYYYLINIINIKLNFELAQWPSGLLDKSFLLAVVASIPQVAGSRSGSSST